AQGFDYASEEARRGARNLFLMAREATDDLPTEIRLSLLDDADLALRLGARLDAEPWNGPAALAELADGETVRVLSEAAVLALAARGADRDAAQTALLGARTLTDAPGLDTQALAARGFSALEIAAAEAEMPFARRLTEAFRPAIVGEGFLRDVLGATADQLADPGLDVLALAGFDPEAIAAAETYDLGADTLADCTALTDDQRRVLRRADEIDLDARTAMLQALAPVLDVPPVLDVALPWDAGLDAV